MREKHNLKSTVGAVMTFVIFFILLSCYAKTRVPQDPGSTPERIKWNNKTYSFAGETIRSVNKKLGVSETSTGGRCVVYSIPNIGSDKKIAIEQSKGYFDVLVSE